MADQKSRGGQKQAGKQGGEQHQKRGTATQGQGERPDEDKQKDQVSKPDDAERQATQEQR